MRLDTSCVSSEVPPPLGMKAGLFTAKTTDTDSPLRVSYCLWNTRHCLPIFRPLRTLVVDNYAIGTEALCAALNAEGHFARYALGGVEAVSLVYGWTPDVILLDINMPDYDGYDTARILRKFSDTQETGIIAFTALSAPNVIAKAQAAGIDAYCQKGTPMSLLFGMIDELVGQAP